MYKNVGWTLISAGLVIVLLFTTIGNYINFQTDFSPDILSKYGGFIGGTAGVLFSLAGYFLVYEGLRLSKTSQFENTFFNLISSFNDFRKTKIGLKFKNEGEEESQIKTGHEFFEILMRRQINPYNKELSKVDDTTIKTHLGVHRSELSQYLGQLNMIIYKLESAHLTKKEKLFYIDYVKSILSEIEEFIIKKNSLVFNDRYKFLEALITGD